jgi:putative ABC transport system permease protein
LLRLKPPAVPITFEFPLDAQVIGFNFGISLLTGLIFGSAPALRGSKINVAPNLKEGTQGSGWVKSRLRNGLVIGQVSVCTVLLICAGLCVRSLLNAQSVDIGFEPRNALAASFDLRTVRYSEAQRRSYYKQLLERVEALPGVQSASLANHLPLGPSFLGTGVAVEGHQPPEGQSAFAIGTRYVGPRYFQGMGTPLMRGRGFTERESETGAGVVIVDETMARRFWPNEDPVGRRIDLIGEGSRQSAEIIGIAKAGKYRSLGEEPRPFMYRPFSYMARATLVVRTAGNPEALLAPIRREAQALDPNLALVQLVTLEEHMAFPLFAARASGTLLGALGFLALILALVGLYGVLAFLVSQRTREIGIRMALGAERSEVLKLVMRHGLSLTLIGVGVGLAGAFAVTRILSSVLYGIQPTDPPTFIGVSLLLILVAALACFIPAHRATRVDPTVALRYE